MKTKLIICLLLITGMAFSSFGQTEKGRYLIGGSIRGQFNEGAGLTLTPTFGYFVRDNIAIGGVFQLSVDDSGTGLGLGPLARYYFSTGNSKIKPFGQAFMGIISYSPDGSTEGSTGLEGNLAGGVAFFLNEHVAIEPDLRIEFDTRENYSSGAVSINVGIQVYLP